MSGYVGPQFPEEIWDGLSQNPDRVRFEDNVDPDLHDFNRQRSELRAVQEYLFSGPSVISAEGVSAGGVTTYTLQPTTKHSVLLVNASSEPAEVILPNRANQKGYPLTIVKIDSSAYTITVKPSGSEKIKGEDELVIQFQWSSATIVSPELEDWVVI